MAALPSSSEGAFKKTSLTLERALPHRFRHNSSHSRHEIPQKKPVCVHFNQLKPYSGPLRAHSRNPPTQTNPDHQQPMPLGSQLVLIDSDGDDVPAAPRSSTANTANNSASYSRSAIIPSKTKETSGLLS